MGKYDFDYGAEEAEETKEEELPLPKAQQK